MFLVRVNSRFSTLSVVLLRTCYSFEKFWSTSDPSWNISTLEQIQDSSVGFLKVLFSLWWFLEFWYILRNKRWFLWLNSFFEGSSKWGISSFIRKLIWSIQIGGGGKIGFNMTLSGVVDDLRNYHYHLASYFSHFLFFSPLHKSDARNVK